MVSFGSRYYSRTPTAFPIGSPHMIAPFWESNSLSQQGTLYVDIVDRQHATLSVLLEPISTFISDREDIDFEATWFLLIGWEDTCPYNSMNSFCNQVNYSRTIWSHACIYVCIHMMLVFKLLLIDKQLPDDSCYWWREVICCLYIQMWRFELVV